MYKNGKFPDLIDGNCIPQSFLIESKTFELMINWCLYHFEIKTVPYSLKQNIPVTTIDN